jgi:hypothetical protein
MAFHVHRRRTLISLVSLVSQRKERTIVICHPHREDAMVEMTGWMYHDDGYSRG